MTTVYVVTTGEVYDSDVTRVLGVCVSREIANKLVDRHKRAGNATGTWHHVEERPVITDVPEM